MKSILIIFCILSALLAWGYRLTEPMSGSFFRYLYWSTTHRNSTLRGQVHNEKTAIHFVRYGKGPAILLLHGGLSNRLAWFSQIPELVDAGRQVIVLDVRGHGFSGLGKKSLNYRLLADDAIRVMDQLQIQKADIIGWSDGGNTALVLAQNNPERINRIVAISANYTPDGLTPETQQETYIPSSGIAYWFKRWWSGAGANFQSLEKRIHAMWRTYPLLQPADLKAIEVPTLVIVGRHDIISTDHAKKMAALLPHGSLEMVPGGHSTPITHSIQINQAIFNFLELHTS